MERARLNPRVVLLLSGLAFASCQSEHIIGSPPVIDLGIAFLEFGAVPVGHGATQRVVIQNIGKSGLRLDTPSFTGDEEQVFTVPAYDAAIAPGTGGILAVTFAPKNVRRYDAVLTIPSNDPERPTVTLAVGGDGYRKGALAVDPDRIDFGMVNAGAVETGSVAVRNTGNGDLEITGIGLAEGTNPDFSILSSTKPGTLAGGAEISIRLAYRPGPLSTPPSAGTLLVRSDDPFAAEVPVTLTAILNRAPVADAGPDQDTDPFVAVTLDGSASTDPDGDLPLAFAWTLARRPEGSDTTLAGADTVSPTLTPDLVGVYEAELNVTDSTGLQSLLPDRVAITAVPAERVLCELVWDSPIADLDLHLLQGGGTFSGPQDCFFGNRAPDWGVAGDPLDDPSLLRDDLAGFGPETIGYDQPADGFYQLIVDYFAAHTPSGSEPTTATLRVFIDGILQAEIVRRLDSQGQRWRAVTVQWPEGAVLPVDVVE